MSSGCKVSVMLLGEVGVGKTALLFRFDKGKFTVYNASTSISRYFKNIHVVNTDVQLELYDTGGDGRFRNIVKANYKNVDGVLLVYDTTDVSSFFKLERWLAEVRSCNEKAIVIIVGNKSDTPDTKAVSRTMVKSYAFKEQLEYYESSAKTGENVNQIFERMVQRVLEVKNVISPTNRTESQNHVYPAESADSAINPSLQSTNNPPDLHQPPVDSVDSSSTTNQPLEPLVIHSNQTVHSSNEPEGPDTIEEPDWCFPDLEYLNSTNRNSTVVNGGPNDGSDDLPPIVPLPDDIIVLHVEKCRDEAMRKKEKKKFGCF